VILIGFVAMTAGFVLFLPVEGSWKYSAFVLPIVLVAAGMAFSNGPCSAIGTSSVPEEQVGSASGISNMARYVGAAVMTAIVAAVYSSTSTDAVAAGDPADEALATAFSRSSLVLAIISASGIALALLAARHRPPKPMAVDLAAAASASTHTLPVPHPDAPERELAGAR
jgi:MFS family permease